MRLFLFFCALGLLFWGGHELYQKKTRFGLLAKFASPTFSPSPEWELPPLLPEEQVQVDEILSQKFTYFARGSQAFAFISEDNKYILKLFKQHKWHPKNLLGYFPLSFNPYHKDYLQRQKKQDGVLSSCKAALVHAKEDTGVLFAHLNPTSDTLKAITLIDKHGKAWELDLNKSCFLLQRKADLFYPHFKALMEKGDEEGAKQAITATLELLARFIDTGVFENNAILRKNFGFLDERPIQFDIGKFKCDPFRQGDRQDIRIVTERFYCWTEKNYPTLIPHFDAKLSEICPLP